MTNARYPSSILSVQVFRIFPLIRHNNHQKKNQWTKKSQQTMVYFSIMRFRAFLKWYASYIMQFLKSWDSQSKQAILTFSGLAIALTILIPFHINDYVLAGSIFGILILGVVNSNKTSTKGHQEQRQQQKYP